MISAGNDIVALNNVNSRRVNEFAFYSKILSPSEQALYHSPQFTGLVFQHYVWFLWSVKESVYKFLKRNQPELVFSPIKIDVSQIEFVGEEHTGLCNQKLFRGIARFNEFTLFFTSKITPDWIASVANDTADFKNVYWQVVQIADDSYNYQSNVAKQLLLEKLNTFIPGKLKIEKNPVGYPEIIKNNQKVNIPVSIAHHGFFIAYAINLTDLVIIDIGNVSTVF